VAVISLLAAHLVSSPRQNVGCIPGRQADSLWRLIGSTIESYCCAGICILLWPHTCTNGRPLRVPIDHQLAKFATCKMLQLDRRHEMPA